MSTTVVGAPLCEDCYDFEGAVLQNACTPELWRRTTIYVLRHVAAALGWTQRETKERVRLSFCRVAEFQRRGVVHLHAVIRADGVDGKPPPLTAEDLARAALSAARAVAVGHPWESPVGAARSTSRCSTAQPVNGPSRWRATWPSTPPRARTAAVPSTPRSARKRTWPAVAPAASAPNGRGRLGPRRRHDVRAVPPAPPCPRSRLRRSFPVQVPALLHQLQRPQGRPGRLARSEAAAVTMATAAADRSLERRLRAVGAGWANRGEACGPSLPAAAATRGATDRQRGVVQPDGAGYGAIRSVVMQS